MAYYLGTGTEFKKEGCKEYKTKDGATKAVAKVDGGVVWDEEGQVIATAANPPGAADAADAAAVAGEDGTVQQDGALQETAGEGAETGVDGLKEDSPENAPSEQGNGGNGANTAPGTGEDGSGQQDSVIIPQGKMTVTVTCEGTLNLRRTADWGNGNICGRASKGQTYYVKAIHTVKGKKMVQTIDGIYLSGQTGDVLFEQM